MKIRTNTPDLLVIEERPWLLGLGIIGFTLIFAAIGLGLMADGEWAGLLFFGIGGGLGLLGFWAFVRRVQVVFHRPGNWVEIRRATMTGRSTVRHALDEISRAIVETTSGENADLHRVTLEIDHGQSAGRHPLTLAYSNVGHPHAVARAVNDWLSAAATAAQA